MSVIYRTGLACLLLQSCAVVIGGCVALGMSPPRSATPPIQPRVERDDPSVPDADQPAIPGADDPRQDQKPVEPANPAPVAGSEAIGTPHKELARRLSAAKIQATLDRDGYIKLPTGYITLDRPLVITANQKLEGSGKLSILNYVGAAKYGAYAIVFGDRAKPNYGCYLESFSVRGGGIHVVRFGQHCGIDKVWAVGSKADGVLIDGPGDKFTLRDVIADDNAQSGFCLRGTASNNGICFDHCNADRNGGAGLTLETVGDKARLHATVIRDCTFQGNNEQHHAGAEMVIEGGVNETRIENIWLESPKDRQRNDGSRLAPIGILVRAKTIVAGGRKQRVAPANLTFVGNNHIVAHPRAIVAEDLRGGFWIDQLSIRPHCRVYYRTGRAVKPSGEMRLFSPALIQELPDDGG